MIPLPIRNTIDLGAVRVMDCPNCGPTNHRLQLRYWYITFLHVMGLPLTSKWTLICTDCSHVQKVDTKLLKLYVQDDVRPWTHRNLGPVFRWGLIGLGLVVLLFTVLQWNAPSRQERLQPKFNELAVGDEISLQLGALEETATNKRYAIVKVVKINGDQIVLRTSGNSYTTAFRLMRAQDNKEPKDLILEPVKNLFVQRKTLQRALLSGDMIDIDSAKPQTKN
jgi:hypothetical protein